MNKNTIGSISKRLSAVLLVGSSLMISGCSITMKHDELAQPGQKFSDPITIDKRAEGIPARVGWGRITLFAIPVAPVRIKGDGPELMMLQIQDALKQVGYQVTTVDSEKAAEMPTLKCTVKDFSFSNYTYLAPIVPTWGDISLNANLVSPAGQVLWSQEFKGDGFTLNFFDGYTSAAEQSMTEILDEMIKAFTSESFRQALTQNANKLPANSSPG